VHNRRSSDAELVPNGPLLLTLPELAAHLRVDRATVYRLLHRRELPDSYPATGAQSASPFDRRGTVPGGARCRAARRRRSRFGRQSLGGC
jgi:hypothetical protein